MLWTVWCLFLLLVSAPTFAVDGEKGEEPPNFPGNRRQAVYASGASKFWLVQNGGLNKKHLALMQQEYGIKRLNRT